MKRLLSYLIILSISAALQGAASSSLSDSRQVTQHEIPASILRIVSLQLHNVAGYRDLLPQPVQSRLKLFQEVVAGNQGHLQDSFAFVHEDELSATTCLSSMTGKHLVYIAIHALLLNNDKHVLKYAKPTLELSDGFFLPADKVSAYLLLEELVSRTSEPSARETLIRLLDKHEEDIVVLSRACDQQIQDEFLYRVARKFWHESSYNPEQKIKATGCLSFLKRDPRITGSLKSDVEHMSHSIENDSLILARVKPAGHLVLKKQILERFRAEAKIPGSIDSTGGSSSSSEQSSVVLSQEGSISPVHENTTLEKTNIKRIERQETVQPVAAVTKRQRKIVTNTPWY